MSPDHQEAFCFLAEIGTGFILVPVIGAILSRAACAGQGQRVIVKHVHHYHKPSQKDFDRAVQRAITLAIAQNRIPVKTVVIEKVPRSAGEKNVAPPAQKTPTANEPAKVGAAIVERTVPKFVNTEAKVALINAFGTMFANNPAIQRAITQRRIALAMARND